VLSPAEPAAVPGAELALEAEALIKEARQRRRRRWIRGTGAVLLAAAGATTWLLVKPPSGVPHAANGTVAQAAAANACAAGIAYGPLPSWARDGFTPPDLAMPHVLSAHGGIVAILWARHDPLMTPQPRGTNNKILWASKPGTGSDSLEITAQLLVGGHLVGPVQRRSVAGGPGPSIIDMPTAGCWQFTLNWGGRPDTLDLPYAAG
jgi:hypothetical protein